MRIIKFFLISIIFLFNTQTSSYSESFNEWLNGFKNYSLMNGVSEVTYNKVMTDVKFLPKVIEYDRYQPEFYEDTITYISKRASKFKVKKGMILYNKNMEVINKIEKNFLIEKELLLSLMGIETNFGSYVGKMDIISSLATLSFDKRRSEFFTNELLTILLLKEKNVIDHNILYGSWAGAFGNFQFMPTTIKNYAIDFNSNKIIELKDTEESFASAANYLNKIGWKKNKPCFSKIDLKTNVPKEILNTSAKKIHSKRNVVFFKQYIKNFDSYKFDKNLKAALVTPDSDIIPGAKVLKPAYLIFDNYELILKWNRSLRFALAVCTLKDNFSNEF